jgi:type II secretory pathway pseudopilin PulG
MLVPMHLSHPNETAISMARRAPARRAMSLLELAAVVLIVGLLGATAATRYGSSTIADTSAQGFARRIALDCSQARRRAIATGANHLVRFTVSGGAATQYSIFRRAGASTTQADETHAVPAGVTVTTAGGNDIEFTFTGEALASHTITIQAPDRTWTVTVPQVTGKAFVQ